MIGYLKRHEKHINTLLESNIHQDWGKILFEHERKIHYLQHERMIHLLVMLFVGLFTLLSFFFALLLARIELYIIIAVFLSLCIPYIYHYYQLENGVQRLYRLSNKIEERLN
jgi:hypothetical protein